MATTPKMVRLSDEEIAMVECVKRHWPEISSESGMIRAAFVRGLHLLMAEILSAGATLPGVDPRNLAMVLQPRIAGAQNLIAQFISGSPVDITGNEEMIVPNASEDFAALGGEAMGDWD